MAAAESAGVGVGVMTVVVTMLVVMIDWVVAVRMGVVGAEHEPTPAPASTAASTWAVVIGSDSTIHATAAPRNGAVAKTSCARAAPSKRAPATHSVIDTP